MRTTGLQDKMESRKGLGVSGEQIAADYLKKRGFKILARNVRYKAGEIDIVARKGKEIHFVEVRARRGLSQVTPIESITETKRLRIKRAAEIFLLDRKQNIKDINISPCYFSVIGIQYFGDEPHIEFISDAFI